MRKIAVIGLGVSLAVSGFSSLIFQENFYVGGTRDAGTLNGMTVGSTATALYDSGYTWSATSKIYVSGTGDAGYLRYWGGADDIGVPGVASVNFSAFSSYSNLTLTASGADIEGPVMRFGFGSGGAMDSYLSGSGDALYVELNTNGTVKLVKRNDGVSTDVQNLGVVNTANADDKVVMTYDRIAGTVGGYFLNSTGTSNAFTTASIGFAPDLSLVKYEFYERGANSNFPRLQSTALTGTPLSARIHLITITSL